MRIVPSSKRLSLDNASRFLAVAFMGFILASLIDVLEASGDSHEGLSCVHDAIVAEEDVSKLTYVQVKRYEDTLSAHTTAHGVRYRNLTHTPRRGVQPASLDFTINAAVTNDNAPWEPIRIRAFYDDLLHSDRYCTSPGDQRPDYGGNIINCASEQDVLTDKKRDILMNTLVPSAIAMHEQRLQVQRVAAGSAIVVNSMPGRWCGSFTVPEEHQTTGVPDADFVVYVAAGPTSTPSSFIAWAIGCQYFPGTNRPAVGAIYFNPRFLIEQADETAADIADGGIGTSVLDNRIRVAAHELLHALGFTYNAFQRAGMVATVSMLRGKPTAQVLNSSAVRKAAMAHFGCNDDASFPGMELEDQDSAGTSASHWKRRNAKDELMSPIANFLRYTAITIAAMEDLGYYHVSYDKAEYMGWGNAVGCPMLTEKCIRSPNDPTSTTPSVFCPSTGQRYCTRDRLSIGRCYITTYSSSLPVYMQYFETPVQGGGERYVDYCPTVQAYSNAACVGGNAAVIPGSVTGTTARCFDADPSVPLVIKNSLGQQAAVCATVQCNFTTNVYHVQFNGAKDYVQCVPGTTVEPSASSASVFQAGGRVQCPPFMDVCGANPRASFALPAPSNDIASLTLSRSAVTLLLFAAASLHVAIMLL